MNKFQTLAAGIVLFLIAFAGTYMVFRSPIPYAYNNLADSLNQTMHRNGVHWAKIEVDGDQVIVTGSAPSAEALVYAKSLIQEEAGVSASLQDVEVKSQSEQNEWEKFKDDNPLGRFQLQQNEAASSNNLTPKSSSGSSGESGYSDSQIAEQTQAEGENKADNINREYIILFKAKFAQCTQKDMPKQPGVLIRFRDSTAAIIADSLSKLDEVASYNRECEVQVNIKNAANTKVGTLNSRRVDEIRYYLMSAGIADKDIILD